MLILNQLSLIVMTQIASNCWGSLFPFLPLSLSLSLARSLSLSLSLSLPLSLSLSKFNLKF